MAVFCQRSERKESVNQSVHVAKKRLLRVYGKKFSYGETSEQLHGAWLRSEREQASHSFVSNAR